MKYIVAIDSFKGCLTSVEANDAASKGVLLKHPDAEVVQVPVSDGGEGWIAAFHAAIGGELIEADVLDPLMRPVGACYLKKDELAVIEIAKASGLTLLKPEERNPLMASSYGTGMLIADAIRKGCKRFIIGLGGSAISDAGQGMLQALSEAFGNNNPPQSLCDNSHCQEQQFRENSAFSFFWEQGVFQDLHISVATDVANPLCGPMGAAHVFGPQKGATPAMVEELDQRAFDFAQQSALLFGYDCSNKPGAGAAGGLGYAFMQYLHADCRLGIDLLLDTIDFDQILENTDLVITGEGSADAQTLMGKLPSGIMLRARKHGVSTVLIAGKIKDEEALLDAGFAQVMCINPVDLSLVEAMKKDVAERNIEQTVGLLV
ncbi:MAG: glycerate kinase [Bacteroidaceae bacterium]|nr:glycerate kinase [Bacteroidaceae bacterium]